MKPALSTSLRARRKDLPTDHKYSTGILSLTNAAVQAISGTNSCGKQQTILKSSKRTSTYDEPMEVKYSTSSSGPSFSSDNSLKDQREVLDLGANLSSSLSSSQSISGHDRDDMETSLDSSFNRSTAQRVRISSRLLREIKSPLEKSGVTTGMNIKP
jgi:hypothetical protein